MDDLVDDRSTDLDVCPAFLSGPRRDSKATPPVRLAAWGRGARGQAAGCRMTDHGSAPRDRGWARPRKTFAWRGSRWQQSLRSCVPVPMSGRCLAEEDQPQVAEVEMANPTDRGTVRCCTGASSPRSETLALLPTVKTRSRFRRQPLPSGQSWQWPAAFWEGGSQSHGGKTVGQGKGRSRAHRNPGGRQHHTGIEGSKIASRWASSSGAANSR